MCHNHYKENFNGWYSQPVRWYRISGRVVQLNRAVCHERPLFTDTGVIVCFSSEAEEITDSFFIPEGSWSYSINPLNWRTDGTVADKSLNKGACFTDYEGNITEEIPQLTGAYIDEERGALKVTDVTPEDYPAALTFLQDGEYHIYDYQFFYRNLQENVEKRVEAYLG